jgi:hypothetical protein
MSALTISEGIWNGKIEGKTTDGRNMRIWERIEMQVRSKLSGSVASVDSWVAEKPLPSQQRPYLMESVGYKYVNIISGIDFWKHPKK